MKAIVWLGFSMILGSVAGKNHNTKYDRLWRNRKKDCERDTCGHLIPDEAANCVNVCISQSCFNEVYGPEAGGGLEDGEIDTERERTFTTCLRKEARESKRAGKSGKDTKREKREKKDRQEASGADREMDIEAEYNEQELDSLAES